jgi:DNA primase
MISQSVVEEVRARADIVEIVGEHLALKRAGKEYKARCPFHNEKTPSFYVVPSKGFYKCFGCGESGDAFTFLMKRQGLTFQEAVRVVAHKVGVEIPTDDDRRTDDPHRVLYEVVAFAADFFRTNLWQEPAGERARQYLEARGITKESAERFGIGYAPDAWRALREAAHKHGITDEVLLDAGLIKQSETSEDKEPYDRLRDRVIFPIAETTGRTVAFGGRVLKASEGAPKYLNSPETPIYSKGRMLYGLNWSRAAIRREGVALVVEGYMDYVSLASAGVDNVVAGLGTAMTTEQAALLARYTRKAVLLYDSDLAGLKATFRTGDALLQAGVEPLVATLPAGEDPDSLVRKGGSRALGTVVDAAVDVLDRKLQILEQRGFFADIEGVRHALDRLLPTVRAAADPALKDIYMARVEQRTGVRRETIERALTSDRPFTSTVGRRNRQSAGPSPSPSQSQSRKEPRGSEKQLIMLLLRDSSRIGPAGTVIQASHFRDPVYREIFEWIRAGQHKVDTLSAEAQQQLGSLQSEPMEFGEGDRAFDDMIADMLAAPLVLEMKRINRALHGPLGIEEQERAMRRKLELKAKLKEMGTELAKIGFKTTRYRGVSRVRAEKPSPGQSE